MIYHVTDTQFFEFARRLTSLVIKASTYHDLANLQPYLRQLQRQCVTPSRTWTTCALLQDFNHKEYVLTKGL